MPAASAQPGLLAGLARRADERAGQGLHRRRLTVDSPQGREIVIDGVSLLAFCSNDYLGLSVHPDVSSAMAQAVRRWGAGAGASHLVSGHMGPHAALEDELAAFVGAGRALLFSTGYMANLATVTALAGRDDTVVEDRLNHASLLDAAVLSRATLRRYRHADAAGAARMLGMTRRGGALLATDGVFSMDGDVAPLGALNDAARRAGAVMLVDDAHGLGVLGDGGRGSLAEAGIRVSGPVLLVGTLGKAFGTQGAFVAGDAEVIEALMQFARPYIYTTAMPPAVAEASRAALSVAQREGWRRKRLAEHVDRFRAGAVRLGLALATSRTAIQPLIVGDAQRALALSAQLRRRGVLVPAIRPPTVPAGSARLRITLSAAHTAEDVDRLIEALGDAMTTAQPC